MSEEQQVEQAAIPEPQVADTSVTADSPQTAAPDTAETVAETEEQRAERLVKQNQLRREREQRKLNQRFGEITSERDAYKMALEILQRGGQQQPAAKAVPAEDQEPKESDYDDYAKFSRDMARYEARQVVKAETARARQEWESDQSQKATQTQLAQTLGEFEKRREAYAKVDPDYDSAADELEKIPLGPHNVAMAEAIIHHPDSPKVLKFLGKNLAEADRISRLPPVLQAAAIGEIAAALKVPPQVSKAPPPGVPVGGRGSAQAAPSSASEYFDQITRSWRGGKR